MAMSRNEILNKLTDVMQMAMPGQDLSGITEDAHLVCGDG